jgi:glyoxylase-like metal-dependent hydrolase (beta-lactamase superfamily II)
VPARTRVLASPEVAGWVAAGDEHAMSLEHGQRAGCYPPGYRFAPCPRVEPWRDGERLSIGAGVKVEAIATPGHAAGHLAFLASGVSACFVGDLVFHGGQVSLESTWDCSLQDYAESVRRLSRRAFEVMLPGHHSFSLARGDRHVRVAAERFESGFVPRSVV